jgi:6-phosphogluconolactonase
MRLGVGGNGNRGRWPRRWLLGAVLAGCLAWAAPAQAQPFVYVSTSASVFQYDAMAGSLSPLTPASVPLGGANPFGMVAVSPDGRSVYVPASDANAVFQYDVGATGPLTPKSPASVAAGDMPAGVAVSPDGKSVYVANGFSNNPATVSQYDVGAGGVLTPKSPATVTTLPGPAGVAVSPDGKSVYVTNAFSNPGEVSQYSAGAGGALVSKSPATVPTNVGFGGEPEGVAVSPDGRSAYVVNGGFVRGGGSIAQYSVGADGALSPKTPAGFQAGSVPVGVAVSPDGRSVYVADRLNNDVLQYSVGADGALSPLSPAAVVAGSNPSAVAVSPDGKSVYVSNSGGNTVSQYSVGADGALTAKNPTTVAAGSFPIGIAVSPLPRVPTSKEQCKHGGWRNYPQFKNQGQCVAFVVKQARQSCLAERAKIGLVAFRNKYGLGPYHLRALRRCVNQATR